MLFSYKNLSNLANALWYSDNDERLQELGSYKLRPYIVIFLEFWCIDLKPVGNETL